MFGELPVLSNTVLIITFCVKVVNSTFLVKNKRTKWAELSRYYLARSAKLPKGLYILPMFFLYFLFFFIFFLVVAPGATLAQKPMVRSSPKFQDW